MKSIRAASFLLAVLCGGIFLPASAVYAGDQIKMTPQQARALSIETAPLGVSQGAAGTGLPAQVVIPNGQIQVVSAPLAGLIQSLAVATNDTVKKGQLLARLSSPMLVEAQRDFLQAATQSQLARNSLKRDAQLFKEGIIAEGRYLATKSGEVQASAALSERRQALRLYGMSEGAIGRLQSSYVLSSTLDIVSPLDGVVLEQMATAGQRAEAASPLYKVAKLAPLWLEIQVPMLQATHIAPGAAVSVPALGVKGKVLSVGRNVNASQAVMVRAEISEGLKYLHTGQYVEALIAAPSAAKQWRVPNNALVRGQDKIYLFVQTASGFRAQPVTIVNQAADSATISGELQGNERVAVQGLVALKGAWQGLGGGE